VEDWTVTSPGHATPSQGDVLISNPSPLTGERELSTVVSADIYNTAGGPTVLVAEIETGTRYRATAYATETDYGVVLADRVVWMPVDMLGEHFGRLTDAQRDRVIDQTVAVLRGH
jgi:mRNA-degrading endonuclease toxin of MazEF toxin-antitoxin module